MNVHQHVQTRKTQDLVLCKILSLFRVLLSDQPHHTEDYTGGGWGWDKTKEKVMIKRKGKPAVC